MKKVRRKLRDSSGETAMRTVWECHCKLGTHSSSLAYFFDKPKLNLQTQVVELNSDYYNLKSRKYVVTHVKAQPVYIDDISPDNFVYCYYN